MAGFDNLDGDVAVVTGGASGIGRAIATDMRRRGATVIIADVEEAALRDTAAAIGAIGIPTDISGAASVEALAAEVRARFGPVRFLFANAGVASTGRIEDMQPADWRWLIDVNLFGAINTSQAFLPLLRDSARRAHIAVTASLAAMHVTPGIGGYTVSKFAVAALAETLAIELEAGGDDIGVTIFCPGPVSTRLGSSQRNRPAGWAAGGLIDSDLEASEAGGGLRWLPAERAAAILFAAMARGDLYAFTHPELAAGVRDRHRRISAALAETWPDAAGASADRQGMRGGDADD